MWLTSLTGTDSSAATAARPSSSNGRPEVSSMRARRRRKLKNSVLWAAVVPVRTIDQLRRIKSCIAERIHHEEIGRASGRERVCQYVKISVVAGSLKKKIKKKKN